MHRQPPRPAPCPRGSASGARHRSRPLATLARRRFQLTARTPRELVVPLLTPILFALVIAPALQQGAAHRLELRVIRRHRHGRAAHPAEHDVRRLGVIVDRETGAARAASRPIPRVLLVLGNLIVAFAITALQVGVLIAAAVVRQIHFHRQRRRDRVVRRRSSTAHHRHVRRGRDPRRARPQAGGVHRAGPRDRDRTLVPRRVAVPDHGDPGRPDLDREVPAAHPRARAHALRALLLAQLLEAVGEDRTQGRWR